MEKVLVLLSSYNGSKYIREQIESVLSQNNVEVTLLIRDDGSSDDTVRIIKEYCNNNKNVKLLEGTNCKSAQSFMRLLAEAYCAIEDYDYFAFCDQDDIWLTDKLSSAVVVLRCADNDKAQLYLGSYKMVDENLTQIPTEHLSPNLIMESAFVSNPATGCTMVFNKRLLETVVKQKPSYMIMHDYWMYLVCLAVDGFVYYDSNPHMLYRQHDHNVIGGMHDSIFKRWSGRIKKVFLPGDCYKSKMAHQLLECYGDLMKENTKSFVEQVASCNKYISRFKLLFNKNFRGVTFDERMQLFGLIVLGKL